MSKDLKFADIKDEITGMVDETLKKNLDGKNYDQKEAQSIINQIVDEIIKNLHSNHKEFKFVVNGTILMVRQLQNMKMKLVMLLLMFLELFLK